MSEDERLFRSWHRTNRPVSRAVNPVALWPVLQDSRLLGLADLTAHTDDELALEILHRHWRPPSVGDRLVRPPIAGAAHRRAGENKDTWSEVPTWRLDIEWAIDGKSEWLQHWPDGAGVDLVASDELFPAPDVDDPDR